MGNLKPFKKKFLVEAMLYIILFLSLTLIAFHTITVYGEHAYSFIVAVASAFIIGLAWCKILKFTKKDTLVIIVGGIIVITLMGAVFFSSLPVDIKGHLLVAATLVGVLYIWVLTKLGIVSKRRWD